MANRAAKSKPKAKPATRKTSSKSPAIKARKPVSKPKPKAPAKPKPKASAKPKAKASAKPKASTKAKPKAPAKPKAAAKPKSKASAKPKAPAKPKAAAVAPKPKAQTSKPKAQAKLAPVAKAEPPKPKFTIPPAPVKKEPKPKIAKRVIFDAKTLQSIRENLTAQREELEAQMRDIEETAFATGQSEMSGEAGYDEDYADAGTATFEREKDLSIANSLQNMIDKIDKATEKIDDGTYGVCESCGNPISADRLKALPSVLLCINCKKLEERR